MMSGKRFPRHRRASGPPHPQPNEEVMAKSIDTLISEVRTRVRRLLHDTVIEHTIVVMRELQMALGQLAGLVGGNAENLTDKQKQELREILEPLTSESIREALHKGELHITNGIIRSKNRIFTAMSMEIPIGHEEINAADFPNYNW